MRRMQAFLSATSLGVRRQGRLRYATLAHMHRVAAVSSLARFPQGMSNAWLARRWYYAARSHRSYSVRQISAGDRRLLAEFALTLDAERDRDALRDLTRILFERVIVNGSGALGFAALEATGGG